MLPQTCNLAIWQCGWRTSIKMNDEKKCPNTVLCCVFSRTHAPFVISKLGIKKYKKITCRVTLCGREMITSVYILNLRQNSKSYPDAGKGEHFLHFRNNTRKTHPSVCCKKMSKSHSHVYQKNPKCQRELKYARNRKKKRKSRKIVGNSVLKCVSGKNVSRVSVT